MVKYSDLINQDLPSELITESELALTTWSGLDIDPTDVTKSDVGLGNVTNDTQLKIASNLSDLDDPATARSNLGVSTASGVSENLMSNSGFGVGSYSSISTVTNLVTGDNSDFDTIGDWYTTNGAISSVAGGNPGNCMRVNNDTGGASKPNAQLDITFTKGKIYRVMFSHKDDASSAIQLHCSLDGVSTQELLPDEVTDGAGGWTVATYVFKSKYDNTKIFFLTHANIDNGRSFYIDNVTVEEITSSFTDANDYCFDGWMKGTFGSAYPDVYRQHNDGGTYTKGGSFYSAKIIGDTSDDTYIAQPKADSAVLEEWYQRFAGRQIAFGCWVKASVANKVKIGIGDGVWTYSALNVGTDWEWLELSKYISNTPSRFQVLIYIAANNPSVTLYVSQPIYGFGSYIGEGNYSIPFEEIIYLETPLPLNGINWDSFSSSGGYLDLDLEGLSNGKIPNALKAAYVLIAMRDSVDSGSLLLQTVGPYDGVGIVIYGGKGNDVVHSATAWIPTNFNGNLKYRNIASGANTQDLYIGIQGVQLR